MVKVDLITGFLGAGKTTFIREYLKHLQRKGFRVRIIENEFGSVGVDTELLKKERVNCDITDLTGLCMCCTGRSEFIYQLEEAARLGYDRVIVEPSGIYDVDEFFGVMDTPAVSRVCEIGSILTIVDAGAVICPTEESKYLTFCQLLSAGYVILSKVQCGRNSADAAIDQLHQLMREFDCPDGLQAPIWRRPWIEMSESDFEMLMDAGFNRFIHDRIQFSHNETFQTMTFAIECMGKRDIEGKIRRLFRSAACGRVFRAKGFVRDINKTGYEVNCTSGTLSIEESDSRKRLLVVIGQNLNENAVGRVLGFEQE